MTARSMTGFGEAAAEEGDLTARVEIRSLNHRGLDMKFRIPAEAARLEIRMRRAIRERVRRGSLQVKLEVDFQGASEVRIDRQIVEARLVALREIAAMSGVPVDPDPNSLVSGKGVLTIVRPEAPPETLRALVDRALDGVLTSLDRTRAEEGLGLADDIVAHAAEIEGEVSGLAASVRTAVGLFRSRLRRRIARLLEDVEVDPQRLAQEMAVLAAKSDVSEELQRLKGHLDALSRCIAEGRELGKRIDFIAQEMNREANTLRAKAQALGAGGLAISQSGLRIRASIGKIREQAMNLE